MLYKIIKEWFFMKNFALKKMFLVLILFFTLSTILMADSYYMTSSSSGKINVRESPGTESRIVLVEKNGQVVRVIDKQGNWYKIQVEAGDVDGSYQGYIHKSMLAKVTEFSIYSKEGYTNVRSAPNSSSKVVTQLQNGDLVYGINKTGEWYYVILFDSDVYGYGYIHQSQLRKY